MISQSRVNDDRGSFGKLFESGNFRKIGFLHGIEQINISTNKKKGTIRGMHFQLPPFSETKIISCVKGKVFDVAVDLRKDSPTFLQWHAEILSCKNYKSFLIPDGFAHGFQTLEDDCELLYIHSGPYKQEYEGTINAFDPKVSVEWPIGVSAITSRDRDCKMISGNYKGINCK